MSNQWDSEVKEFMERRTHSGNGEAFTELELDERGQHPRHVQEELQRRLYVDYPKSSKHFPTPIGGNADGGYRKEEAEDRNPAPPGTAARSG